LCKRISPKERGFHSKVKAGEESWIYGYDPGTNNSHPRGRVILLLSQRVEADEFIPQEPVVCFLEQ
jgi:hypothetical protein